MIDGGTECEEVAERELLKDRDGNLTRVSSGRLSKLMMVKKFKFKS